MSWSQREAISEAKYLLGSDDGKYREVHQIGKYLITIAVSLPDVFMMKDALEVKYKNEPDTKYNGTTFEDGKLCLDIGYLIDIMLTRMDPAELAKALWINNRDVRVAFVDNLVEHWSSGIENEHRQRFLNAVNENLYETALNDAVNSPASREELLHLRSSLRKVIDDFNDLRKWIEKWGEKDGQPIVVPECWALKTPMNQDPEYRIVGDTWSEARAYWREWLKSTYPPKTENTYVSGESLIKADPEAEEPPVSINDVYGSGPDVPYDPSEEIPF